MANGVVRDRGQGISQQTLDIYTDASYCPKSRVGVAGFRFETNLGLKGPGGNAVVTKVYGDTTNTRLELQGILFAFKTLKEAGELLCQEDDDLRITIFTDCKTVTDLRARREKLFGSSFRSARSGKTLSNADLYKEIFCLLDLYDIEFVLLPGHVKNSEYISEDQSKFREVDRFVRNELRRLTPTMGLKSP